MKRTLYILVGFVLGFVLAKILRRPQMQRLATLEVDKAEEKEQLAAYVRQWREEVAALPFEERMKVELWEAGMRLNNWMPDVPSEEDDDEEA